MIKQNVNQSEASDRGAHVASQLTALQAVVVRIEGIVKAYKSSISGLMGYWDHGDCWYRGCLANGLISEHD